MRRRPTPRQLELFARPDDPDLVPAPRWRMLPEGARATLTELMIRLILDHAAGVQAPRRTEARHEACEDQRAPSGAEGDPPRAAVLRPTRVPRNRESGALRYATRDRLATLGWSRVGTIDDELGRSAAGGVARAGFDRVVAEVRLGKVGAVAAREVSRFARDSRDWRRLIEMWPASSTPSWSIRRPYMRRDRATTACFSA